MASLTDSRERIGKQKYECDDQHDCNKDKAEDTRRVGTALDRPILAWQRPATHDSHGETGGRWTIISE